MASTFAQQFAQNKSTDWLVTWFPRFSAAFALAALTGFLASAIFIVSLYAGGSWDFGKWLWYDYFNMFLAVGFAAVITAGQYFFYRSGVASVALNAFKVVMILFAFGTEVSQTMEREDTHVKTRSVASPTYQATVKAIERSTATYLPTSGNIIAEAEAAAAKAKVEIAACPRYLKGKTYEQSSSYVKHLYDRCMRIEKGNLAKAQAQVKSLKEAEQRVRVHASNTQTQLIDKAHELSYDENQHFSIIRMLKEQLNIAGLVASMLLAALIIGTFEGVFWFLGSMVYSIELCLSVKGLDTKGKRIYEEDLIIEQEDQRVRNPHTYRGTRDSGTHTDLLDSVYPAFSQAVKQGSFKPTFDNVMSTLAKKNLRGEMAQQLAAQVLDKLFQDGLVVRSKVGNSEHDHVRVQATPKPKEKPAPTEEEILEDIYAEYLKVDTLATTARPQKQWVSQQIKNAGLRRNIGEIQNIVQDWMIRAYQDGVMIDNPDWQQGKNVPKYLRRATQLRASVYA